VPRPAPMKSIAMANLSTLSIYIKILNQLNKTYFDKKNKTNK
jgi:hypothetical protein